jgi:muconate cycloisomerase
MKITKMELIPVFMKRRVYNRLGPGIVKKYISSTFIKLHTDIGITGIGELRRMDRGVLIDLDEYVAPLVVGNNPFNREQIADKIIARMWRVNRTDIGSYFVTGVDLALYDLIGKKLELPLFDLLGGLYRDKAPSTWGVGIEDVNETLRQVEEGINKGFTTIKLKVGINLKDDIERIEGTRKLLGRNGKIIADANGAWPPKVAIHNIRKMEKYDLLMIEQPVPGWDIEGLTRVTKTVDTQVMADESIKTPRDAFLLAKKEAADVFNIKISEAGGITGAVKIASIAKAAGISCFLGSQVELGIGTVAAIHFAAATENVIIADLSACIRAAQHSLLQQELKYSDGAFLVPTSPGLGVELDEKKLAKFLQNDLLPEKNS